MGEPAALPNDWGALAEQVRRGHDAARRAVVDALAHAMNAGDALMAAKIQMPHGAWGVWVTRQTGIPMRTASLYMKLAVNRHRLEQIGNSAADLSIRAALRLLAALSPKELDDAAADLDRLRAKLAQLQSRRKQIDIQIDELRLKIQNVAKRTRSGGATIDLHRLSGGTWG